MRPGDLKWGLGTYSETWGLAMRPGDLHTPSSRAHCVQVTYIQVCRGKVTEQLTPKSAYNNSHCLLFQHITLNLPDAFFFKLAFPWLVGWYSQTGWKTAKWCESIEVHLSCYDQPKMNLPLFLTSLYIFLIYYFSSQHFPEYVTLNSINNRHYSALLETEGEHLQKLGV